MKSCPVLHRFGVTALPCREIRIGKSWYQTELFVQDKGLGIISVTPRPSDSGLENAVVLLFKAGKRPVLADLRAMSSERGQFAVTLESNENDAGDQWAELLANGLTFDVAGLAPGAPVAIPSCEHSYGFDGEFDVGDAEAVSLSPGPHLIGGAPMIPVLRCLAWLASELSRLPDVMAVLWSPAGTACEPAYFAESVERWIGGGAFPGLGLTALESQEDGSLVSKGLALFTGQELHIDAELALDKSQGAKVALRLLHWLVENGRVDQAMSLTGPNGGTLILEPRPDEGMVGVWRGSR
ncbi:hypothetical protein [Alteraurantiacibacter aquimixticola]|uniref:Uncharacterized protein n=1 Tax=Alteraurantiacibacter aquimixticola TaxID=2489173 RepID=A0A4V4U8J8_9SPHN|nr:hypothetical protein [Alteraurantiacibacter aquimixticola]TIX50183.1 hypothetical protein E5222_07770 [Alteraurantiacibacter aquimixticola]